MLVIPGAPRSRSGAVPDSHRLAGDAQAGQRSVCPQEDL